ncbi:hypothetical protein [Radiobacillus deserti]|uniref:VOC family protein n=1 Tax=Radiobacillus deserti TaxID=2594883 RepID=A0A516KDJ3_9BACI|nr:hypothetical protein [Radiobacillus deserti]QDP39475.1 hypothetical protein FN924_04365 [Radiobacillus deserti]
MQRFKLKRFDGGIIKVDGDRKKAVDWYCKHFNLKEGQDIPEEEMTILTYPSGFAMTIQNVKEDEQLDSTSNIRFCFETADLVETHSYFNQSNVRTTDRYLSIDGTPSFNFLI